MDCPAHAQGRSPVWASYHIRKIKGHACTGNAGKLSFLHHHLQTKPLVSNPSMHHNMCATHMPWCLTCVGGENVPGIPGACTTRNFAYLIRRPLISGPLTRYAKLRVVHVDEEVYWLIGEGGQGGSGPKQPSTRRPGWARWRPQPRPPSQERKPVSAQLLWLVWTTGLNPPTPVQIFRPYPHNSDFFAPGLFDPRPFFVKSPPTPDPLTPGPPIENPNTHTKGASDCAPTPCPPPLIGKPIGASHPSS